MVAIPPGSNAKVETTVMTSRAAVEKNEREMRAMEEQIAELAAHIHAATCRLLDLILEFDERNGWQGWKSCAHWLSWRTGIGPEAAREKVRVARALPELPLVREAFTEGRLSYSKVRAISRVATPETEDMLLSIAIHGTAAHVEKVVRGVRRADPEGETEEANRRHEGRYLSTRHDEHGNLFIDGRLPPELGARFLAALDAATEQTRREDRKPDASGEPSEPEREDCGRPTFGQRRADALVLLADSALSEVDGRTGGLAGGLAGRSAADAHQVIVHVDAEVLADPANTGRSELEDGVHVSAETSRRIACDAGVVVMVEGEDGEPLSVGRKRRTVPPSIRRALKSRDAGCRFPGCLHTRHLEAHHIEHWAEGGETSLENLVHLCSFHHRELHEGGFRIERATGGELRFFNRYGLEVKEAPSSAERGSAEGLVREQSDLDIHTGRLPLWEGNPIDYDFAVSALLRAAAHRPRRQTAEHVSAETSGS